MCLTRAFSSLGGLIVLSELFMSIPFFVVFVFLNYTEGTLTPLWTLWIAFISALIGAVWAVLFWYTFLSLLIKSRKHKKSGSQTEPTPISRTPR